jgi:hypothetical protein
MLIIAKPNQFGNVCLWGVDSNGLSLGEVGQLIKNTYD